MDAEIVIFCLASAALGCLILAWRVDRGRRAALNELARSNAEHAAYLTNTRMQSYMDGVAQAERESRQAFEHGRARGAQDVIEALQAEGMAPWN